MIQGLLFPAFGFIERNTWAQVAVGLGVGYFILKLRDKWRDRNTAKRVERRIERRSRRQQEEIRHENTEKSAQVERARDTAPRGITSADGVPDDLRGVIFGDS